MTSASLVKYLKATASAVCLVVPLCGCVTDRVVPPSTTADDYKLRHPIVVSEGKTSIDVFPSMGQNGLDRHSSKQIYAFAQQYRETGKGPVRVLVPRGTRNGNYSAFIDEARRVLAAGGARSGVEVATYVVSDPNLASPVRLSFVGVRAGVADQCGQWPSDLGSGSSIDGWENKTYWNFGCATQQMIAVQASDPRDLVTPRGEEDTDTVMRSRGIDQIRKGNDPATQWTVRNSSIGSVGSN